MQIIVRMPLSRGQLNDSVILTSQPGHCVIEHRSPPKHLDRGAKHQLEVASLPVVAGERSHVPTGWHRGGPQLAVDALDAYSVSCDAQHKEWRFPVTQG